MAKPRLDSARTYFDEAQEYENFGRAFITIASGVMLSFGAALVALQESAVNFLVTLVDAFGIGGAAWIFAFTRDPAGYISDSFQSAGDAMTRSPWNELGPFLPWIAVVVAIGVVFVVTWYLDRRDSDVPGTGLDLPLIGNDEDGDPSDET